MHLANGIVDWIDIRALMANRLIALDKCPALVWPQVIREPVVRKGDPASDDPGLRLDSGCMAAPGGGVHLFPFLTVELLKRREFIVQLWRTGEETLQLLCCRLMACCSVRPHTSSSVYLPTWPLDGRNLYLMF